ncbi:MAG: NUDIX hydrolase [Limnobacter sp.]|uniref:NUDIX hydrolase n=1 Tax=Limnobacter sp. TaxID=2003368 RepID=UPI0032EE7E11
MIKPDTQGRGSILVLKNAEGTHDANLWSIPGGAVQTTLTGKPEDPLHCALRETLEEVNRLPEAQVWTNPIVLRKVDTGFTYRFYMCVLTPDSPWNPKIFGEHSAYEWQALEYIQNKPGLHPGLAAAIAHMPNHWGKACTNINLCSVNPRHTNGKHAFITAAQFALEKLETPLSKSIQSRPNQLLGNTLHHLIEHAGSPTEIWLSRQSNATPPGWTDNQLKELPANISDLIKIETSYAKTHVVAYHGFIEPLLLGHWTGEVLMKKLCKHESDAVQKALNNLSWHRNPFDTNNNRDRDLTNLTDYVTNSPSRDNGNVGSFALLSCNPSLFQNCDLDAMESTADYLYNAMNVAPPDVKQWIVDMLKSQNPTTDNQLLDQAATSIMKLCGDANKSPPKKKASVLMQILIPHKLVNDVAYIAKKNGIPDSDNPNPLDTLVRLKSPQKTTEVNNAQSLQIRVLSSALQSPTLAQQLKVNFFSRLTAPQQEAIKLGIESIIKNLEHTTT